MTATLETVSGQLFGRCRVCRCRMRPERATDPAYDGLCFVCAEYGPGERPLRPGLRFRVAGGKVRVVIDEAAAAAMDKSGRFRR